MENTTLPVYFTTSSNEFLDTNAHCLQCSILNTFSIVTYSLIFVLGTIGNGLVIFITGFRMKKTVHIVWILSLAIADFTCSFFLIFSIVHKIGGHWPFREAICKLSIAMFVFNLSGSVFLLVIISVDRCISVLCPVWAQNHRTPRLASFVVLAVWILDLVLCSPVLYFVKTYNINKNTTICSSRYQKTEKEQRIYFAVTLIRFIIGFLIPFIVIVVCYGAVVVRLRRDKLSESRKPFKVITAVIVAFFVCWLPFHFFHFLTMKFFYAPTLPNGVSIGLCMSYTLAYFNSCLNPILYFFVGHNFKKHKKHFFVFAFETAFTDESDNREIKVNRDVKGRSSTELETCGC